MDLRCYFFNLFLSCLILIFRFIFVSRCSQEGGFWVKRGYVARPGRKREITCTTSWSCSSTVAVRAERQKQIPWSESPARLRPLWAPLPSSGSSQPIPTRQGGRCQPETPLRELNNRPSIRRARNTAIIMTPGQGTRARGGTVASVNSTLVAAGHWARFLVPRQ